jgi:2-(1,2-epoxy-1,2-dihydrophenyl)acetyl-CoA isomerase
VISSEVVDGISVVRLDRFERRNALIPDLLQALVAELERAAARERPMVLTAAGSVFCPGADIKWLAECPDPALAVAELVAVHHLAILNLYRMPVPIIAAVNGAVAGGGLGLALAADYRVCAESASFTAAYFRIGLTPDGGASAFLTRAIGAARTMELLLTNRRVAAPEALSLGLVTEVVPDAVLVPRAVEVARSLRPVPAYSLLQTRRLLDHVGLQTQLERESVAIRTAARHPNFRAVLQAFLDHT